MFQYTIRFQMKKHSHSNILHFPHLIFQATKTAMKPHLSATSSGRNKLLPVWTRTAKTCEQGMPRLTGSPQLHESILPGTVCRLCVSKLYTS